ncbi:hypothetical protein BGX20_007351 [Mortierella sp. AD010]|nr:hypothetical protein BGX20_007351 [Mortierella sp. AD010]
MATFHSLSPSLGSHQTRQAPDMFSVELELALPQDHFLPAENIEAQVWTNIIHKLNPDGPEVWSAIPMKLSHVIPGKSIAVFAARLQPTGRGDFGLTARWKSHKDSSEWEWAPTTSGDLGEQNKDVSVSVQVPRSISNTSSWAMGPQSVMIFGQDKPRGEGAGGPGLYLGNHAAATRARISGYESVLSLVGDLLDFDEKIPASDKDLHKDVWIEQAQAASPPRRFSLSRLSSSAKSLDPKQGGDSARRSSIQEFMVNREPGSVSEEAIAAVVDDPEDPPRLTRKSSVTDMMVQPPASTNSSRRQNRAVSSKKSISSISELEREADQEPSPDVAGRAAPAPNAPSKSKGTKGSDSTNTMAAETAAGLPPTPPSSTTTKKKRKGSSGTKGASAAVSETSATKSSVASQQQQSTTASTVSSLDIAAALDASTPSTGTDGSRSRADKGPTSSSLMNSPPPSSARVVSGLSHQAWDSQTDTDKKQPKQPFEHKVISIAPGAHNIISDAALKEAVEFLRTEVGSGKKVLVHCRDGNGRSGSIAIVYIASQLEKNAKEADSDTQGGKGGYYDQALHEVWKWKCDVYPHKGLRQSFERIEW